MSERYLFPTYSAMGKSALKEKILEEVEPLEGATGKAVGLSKTPVYRWLVKRVKNQTSGHSASRSKGFLQVRHQAPLKQADWIDKFHELCREHRAHRDGLPLRNGDHRYHRQVAGKRSAEGCH